ncbi:hypothetical protein [Cytobacillus purgationiresistens]|nr:hypothetical protein [Cytobacillus purgationiresistens]
MIILATPTLALTADYPNNDHKPFVNAINYYENMDQSIYKEYKNAASSMREMISYKELEDIKSIFQVNTIENGHSSSPSDKTTIEPERQVYFFGEEFRKFVVIEGETNDILSSGNSYHRYDNPFEK